MEKEFLNYNLSLKLKELSFDEECFGYWESPMDLEYNPLNNPEDFNAFNQKECAIYAGGILAPLYQQARNFLLEKYGKFPVIFSDGFKWTYDLRWPDPTAILKDPYPGVMFPKYGEEDKREYFDTYQQAELKAIEKIIEFAENEKTE